MIVEQKAVLIFSLLGMDAALNPAFALARGLASMGNEVVFIELTDDEVSDDLLQLDTGLSALRMAPPAPSRWRLPWMRKSPGSWQLDALNAKADLLFSFDCTVNAFSRPAAFLGFWSASALSGPLPAAAVRHYRMCFTASASAFVHLNAAHDDVHKTQPFFLPRSCEAWNAQRFRAVQALVFAPSEAEAHTELERIQNTGLLQLTLFSADAATDEHALYRAFGKCDLIIDLRTGEDVAWLQLHALHSGRHCVVLSNPLNAPVTTVAQTSSLGDVLTNLAPRIAALNAPSEQAHRREFALRFSVEEWLDALPNP